MAQAANTIPSVSMRSGSIAAAQLRSAIVGAAPAATQPAACDGDRCRHDFKISCSGCQLSTICLPIALQAPDIERLDAIIQRAGHCAKANTPTVRAIVSNRCSRCAPVH